MEATQAETPVGLVDEGGRIAGDLSCIRCRYNLRTLPVGGLCPECANAVAESVQCRGRDSAKWLGVVADGATRATTWSLVGLLVCLLLVLASVGQSDWACMFALLILLAGVSIFVMLLRLTVRDPMHLHGGEGISARRVVRACLVLLVAGFLGFCFVIAWYPVLKTWGVYGGTDALRLVAPLVCPSVVILPPALALHLRALMKRIARRDLAKWALGFFGVALVFETTAVGVIGLTVLHYPRRASEDTVALLLLFLGSGLLIAACLLLSSVARALRTAHRQAVEQLEALERTETDGSAAVVSRAAAGASEQVAGERALPP